MSDISVRGDVLEIDDMEEDDEQDGILVTLTVRVHSDDEAGALRKMSDDGMGFLLVNYDCCG